MVTFTELRTRLGITQPVLSKLVRDGLPHAVEGKRKLFDEAAVAEWLIANGLAEEDRTSATGLVATTRDEVAKYYGVHVRTVAEWQTDPTFPGRPGTRNLRDGCYPLDAITRWLQERDAERLSGPQLGVSGGLRDELLSVKLSRERRRDAQEANQLAPIGEVAELLKRQISIAKRLLESLPDKLANMLPADTPAETRGRFIQRAREEIYEAERVIAETLQGDTDEHDDE
jgi:hypothetical protein